MKRFAYLIALVILTFSCQEKWDEHYGDGLKSEDVVSELSVLDFLKEEPEYSKFVAVLEQNGVAEELMLNQELTVWAINNENMSELEGSSDTARLQYHINNLIFGKERLSDGLRMLSLNGKYIMVSDVDEGMYVADSKILKTNMFCQNGVIHEIDAPMVPVISIYEYLLALGDDYSTIVDTLFNSNDTIFDIENSSPIGIDETGNTVYDSIFIIANPIFEEADISSEFEQLTMFVPNNQVVDECLETLGKQLLAMGKEFTLLDTTMAMNWIKEGIFFNGIISDYYAETDLQSAFDRIWRTTVQEINTDKKLMSNGVVYDVTKMKIPNNVYITRIKSLVHYYQYTDTAERDELIQFFNVGEPARRYVYPKTTDSWDFEKYGYGKGVYTVLVVRGVSPRDDDNAAVEFSPLKLAVLADNTNRATEMLIPAGEYKFYMGFRSSNHPYINVYFNGVQAAEELKVDDSSPWNYDRVTETVVSKYDGLGGLVNVVTVEGEGLQHVKIKVEFNRTGGGSTEEMQLYHWALVPTENNY